MTLDSLNKVRKVLINSLPPGILTDILTDMVWVSERLEAVKIVQDEIDEYDTPKAFTRNPKLEAAINTFKEEAEIDPDAALEKYKETADSLGFGVIAIDAAPSSFTPH